MAALSTKKVKNIHSLVQFRLLLFSIIEMFQVYALSTKVTFFLLLCRSESQNDLMISSSEYSHKSEAKVPAH
jgi:hypothetical protein